MKKFVALLLVLMMSLSMISMASITWFARACSAAQAIPSAKR